MSLTSRASWFARFAPLLLAACGFPQVWVEEEERFETTARGVTRVECTTSNGAIEVDAGPAGDEACTVRARKRAGGSDEADARRALAALRLVHGESGGTLTVGWEWGETKRPGWGACVSFSLRIPEDRVVALTTSNGMVGVRGCKAGVHVATSNGAVKLDECSGEWDVNTSNGAITASGAPPNLTLRTSNGAVDAEIRTTGRVDGKVRTSNGRIGVELASAASTRVKAETSNGSVRAEGDWRMLGSGNHWFEASRNGGNGLLLLDTSNGSIRVH